MPAPVGPFLGRSSAPGGGAGLARASRELVGVAIALFLIVAFPLADSCVD